MKTNKKNSKKSFYLIMLMILISLAILACGNTASEDPQKEEQENVVSEGMKEVKDMAGRKMEIPSEINKIFCTSPGGTIAMYTLEPDKLVGWNYELSDKEKSFIPSKYHDLPVLGGWFSKNTGNIEEILKVKPDIIIHMGPINETAISLADEIQGQLKIPVFVIDSELEKADETFSALGQALNIPKAEKMSEYCKNTMEDVKKKSLEIPKEEKTKVYYAEGPEGLETEPKGSPRTKILDMIGVINVAEVENLDDAGRLGVSVEQLLLWNPETIIAWDTDRGGSYDKILQDQAWKSIEAVKKGEVYTIPNWPFNWFDRPDSVNRILGLKWLSNLMYPEVFDYDIKEEVKEFYELFYHYDLSDDELNELLENATRQ